MVCGVASAHLRLNTATTTLQQLVEKASGCWAAGVVGGERGPKRYALAGRLAAPRGCWRGVPAERHHLHLLLPVGATLDPKPLPMGGTPQCSDVEQTLGVACCCADRRPSLQLSRSHTRGSVCLFTALDRCCSSCTAGGSPTLGAAGSRCLLP